MSDKSDLSDIRPAKPTHRLLYCSNCGEKQFKVGQQHCSNCGSSFYTEHTKSPEIEDNDEEIDYSLASIGGWLLLPYIGFYLGALFALLEIFVVPHVSTDSNGQKIFLELLLICMVTTAITCIALIHQRSESLIGSVTVLYALGFILSIDSGIKSHSSIALCIDGLAAAFWLAYFHESKRVKALLGPKK